MRQAKMAVHPYTATGRKPKCRALQGSSNAAGGGDAGSGRSAGMRESGHRRVLKNKFFITPLFNHHNFNITFPLQDVDPDILAITAYGNIKTSLPYLKFFDTDFF